MRIETLSRATVATLILLVAVPVLLYQQGSFSFYDDEGMNLIKAMLVERGHPLYQQTWSDQPPLYTWVLAAALHLGADYQLLALLSLACGALTLLGVALIARELAGALGAFVTAALLLTWAPFVKFASTIVITIPALGLAVASLYLVFRFASVGRPWRLAASGLLLAAACLTKIAILYFVPIVLAAIWILPAHASWRTGARATAIWLIALVVGVVPLLVTCPLDALWTQLLRPHVSAMSGDGFAVETAAARTAMLRAPGMPWLYVSSLLSLVVLALRRRREAAVLAVWLLVVAAWITNHQPLWSHHLPDLLVPMAVCTATGLVVGVRAVLGATAPAAGPAALGLVAFAILALIGGELTHLRSYSSHWRRWYDNNSVAQLQKAADEIARRSGPDDLVLVDRPILAFWADRAPPPELSLVVRKRIASGGLTDSDLIAALAFHEPRLVVLCTDLLRGQADFIAELHDDYERTLRMPLHAEVTQLDRGVCHFYERRTALVRSP